MLILCRKCVKELKSGGEKIFSKKYSDFEDYDENAVCDICDSPDNLSGVIVVGDELRIDDD